MQDANPFQAESLNQTHTGEGEITPEIPTIAMRAGLQQIVRDGPNAECRFSGASKDKADISDKKRVGGASHFAEVARPSAKQGSQNQPQFPYRRCN